MIIGTHKQRGMSADQLSIILMKTNLSALDLPCWSLGTNEWNGIT